MEYLEFFLIVVIAMIILDKWINRNTKKEFQEMLEKNWGTRNDEKLSNEELSRIKYYFEHTKRRTRL